MTVFLKCPSPPSVVSSSDNVMVQYHALGLLYHIRKQDRLAITKLLAKLTKMSLKSPYAVILLIRIACRMIEEEDQQDSGSPYFDFIESCLRHKVRLFVFVLTGYSIKNLGCTGYPAGYSALFVYPISGRISDLTCRISGPIPDIENTRIYGRMSG
jgi:hypothetical protein